MSVFGTTPAAARLVPVLAAAGPGRWPRAWLGTLLFDRRSALAGALVLATTLAFLSLRPRGDVGHAARAVVDAGGGARGPGLRGRGAPRVAVAGARRGAGPRLPDEGPDRPAASRGRDPAAARGSTARDRCPWSAALGARGRPLAFAVLGLGWFALVYQRLGAEPLAYFFLRENLQRFAGETYDVGRPALVLPAGLPRRGAALVALPAARASRVCCVGRSASRAASRASSLLWVAADAGPAQPLARQDRLLPAAALPGALAARRPLSAPATPWGRLDRRLGAGRLAGAAAALVVVARAAAPGAAETWLPGRRPRRARRGPVAAGVALRRRGLAAVARRACSRLRPRSSPRPGSASWRSSCRPSSADQPNRRDRRRTSRASARYRPDARLAYCSDPTRVPGATCCSRRGSRRSSECDLWSLAGSREPFLLLVTAGARTRPSASPRATARWRPTATCRREALTLGGLSRCASRASSCSCANYATRDPEAERISEAQRDYRKMLRPGAGPRAPRARRRAH